MMTSAPTGKQLVTLHVTYILQCQQLVCLEGKVHLVGYQYYKFVLEKAADTPAM